MSVHHRDIYASSWRQVKTHPTGWPCCGRFCLTPTDFRSAYREMFYCLNETGRFCGCEVAIDHPEDILPHSCIALQDNHDGTVTGAIDGRTVGEARFLSFRFFERRSTGELQEVVVSRWSDGSACHLNNCFKSVEFEADCVAHGPFSTTVNTAQKTSCACVSGYARVNAGRGGWQCEHQTANDNNATSTAATFGHVILVALLVRH